MKKNYRIFWKMAYGYILLPFVIFALGWMKIYISLPIVGILCYCYYKTCKESPELWLPDWDRDTIIKFLFAIGIIAIWVYYSGIGKFVFQNTDHFERNSIFNILVEYDWPVVNYEIVPEFNQAWDGTTKVTGLIYYIGFWLPSAVVGKVLGIRAGYYAQAVWAVLGIVLVYYLICIMLKKVVVWPLFILVFFSGLDIVGVFLTNFDIYGLGSKWHLEWWGTPYQYSSMTTQLFWVFNQSVPAWVCTMLMYVQKNNRNLVFILACSMLSSTFPFIGLLLLALFFCFTRKYDMKVERVISLGSKIKSYLISLIKDTCTLQNVLGGGIVGIVSFLYLSGNLSGGRVMAENIRGPEFDNSLPKFVIFLILEVGVYASLIYKYNKQNKLYYFVLLCLCVIPPIKVGYSIDFCMRASIPALFILMLWVIKAVQEAWQKRESAVFLGLIVALIIGSVTPICEFKRTFTQTFDRIENEQIVYEEDMDILQILNSVNFSGDIEKNFFFQYLVK